MTSGFVAGSKSPGIGHRCDRLSALCLKEPLVAASDAPFERRWLRAVLASTAKPSLSGSNSCVSGPI
jgi:hypothetical protein